MLFTVLPLADDPGSVRTRLAEGGCGTISFAMGLEQLEAKRLGVKTEWDNRLVLPVPPPAFGV